MENPSPYQRSNQFCRAGRQPIHHSGWTHPVFFYTPSANTPAEQQINDQVTGIYRSEKADGLWQEPERVLLTQGNNLALDGCPFLKDDVLWFCSIRAGNFRDIDIWTAAWDGTQWIDVTTQAPI